MSPEARAPLRVTVDGVALPEEEGRAMWAKFSAYMEEHRGDLGGFAKSEGFLSAHPRSADGAAVLVLSRTAPQDAYGAVPKPAPGKPPGGGKRKRR